MQTTRRRFLKYALASLAAATAAGTYWASTSRHRAARLFRQIVADARRRVPPAPVRPRPETWDDNAITLCWLGHATVLINFYGVRVLTDPVLGERIGVSLGMGTIGPKRYVAPALRFRELPPLDLVLLSHAHMDHLDLASLGRFPASTPVITARATSDLVNAAGLRQITELGWGEKSRPRFAKGGLEIEAIEVKHWGRRWPSEEIERGYNGYILRREGRALLFAGDTALTPRFADLRSRGPFAAAIMPIGAYDPWIRNHCTPEQAVEMADAAGARYLIPMHHQTFRLSDEPMREPAERLQSALQHEPERLAVRQVGDSFTAPRV